MHLLIFTTLNDPEVREEKRAMTLKSFRAVVVRKSCGGKFDQAIEKRTIRDLPEHDTLIRVHYSSLNYKDCLAYFGNPGVTRKFPHTPGIDAAGVVVSSKTDLYKAGDEVVIVSHPLGMSVPGGFGEYVSSPADWLIPLPQGLTLKESMVYGTAGFTAALSVQALLEHGALPGKGKVVVSGATGGVGILCIAILSKLGYEVVASTGKNGASEFLRTAGAREVISREELWDTTDRGQLPQRWSAGVDTLGGQALSTIIRSLSYEGVAISTGLVASQELNTSVLPFILRGVKLIGINAEGKAREARIQVWHKMATEWKPNILDRICSEIRLESVGPTIRQFLDGTHMGRTIIRLV